MLVKSQPGGRPSAAERQVADIFASWVGKDAVPGLLLTNVHVPHEVEGSRQVGAMVFTPSGLTVLEVHGLTQRQTGTLRCPPDAAWTVDGQTALLATQAHANPAQSLDTNIYATRAALGHSEVEPGPVAGLVVIVPVENGDLHLAGGARRPRGFTVLVTAHRDLRKQFAGKRRQVWTADKVVAACEALGLGRYALSVDELCEDGFRPGAASRGATGTPALRTPRAAATIATASTVPAEPMDFAGEAPTPPGGLPLGELTGSTAERETAAAPIDTTPVGFAPGEPAPFATPEDTAVLPPVPAELLLPPDEDVPLEPGEPAEPGELSEVVAPEPEPVRVRRRPAQVRYVVPVVIAVALAFIVAVLLVQLMRNLFH